MTMISQPLLAEAEQLKSITRAWAAAGATSFEVWQRDRVIVRWAVNPHVPLSPSLRAVIQNNGCVFGDIRVAGVSGTTAQIRLQTDALLLARLIEQEADLNELTTEFVDIQDQLVELCALLHSTRSHTSTDHALHILANEAVQFTKAEGAFVAFSSAVGQAGVIQTNTALLDKQIVAHLTAPIYATAQEYLANDHDDPLLNETSIDNVLLIPIQIHETVTAGCLGLINKPGGFTTPGIKLVRVVAEQVGILLEKELLHQDTIGRVRVQTEMELAREVQERLLPSAPPKLANLDMYARSHPAYEVGGDFYDFVHQAEKSCFITVGDIAGKGMPAALMMTMVRTVVRNKIDFIPNPTPLTVIDRANEDLYRDLVEVSMFATMFVGQYIPEEQILHCSNAGHAPVIYRPSRGSAQLLEADGVPLGMLPTGFCEQQTLSIKTGDVLVIATDGFSEAQNANEDLFGFDRLVDLIELHHDLSAAQLADLIFKEVTLFSDGQPQYDDQTIIVLKGV